MEIEVVIAFIILFVAYIIFYNAKQKGTPVNNCVIKMIGIDIDNIEQIQNSKLINLPIKLSNEPKPVWFSYFWGYFYSDKFSHSLKKDNLEFEGNTLVLRATTIDDFQNEHKRFLEEAIKYTNFQVGANIQFGDFDSDGNPLPKSPVAPPLPLIEQERDKAKKIKF